MKNYNFFLSLAVIFVFCTSIFMASMVEARGRGGGGMRGGGGFSRSSPAAGGGFSSRQVQRPETRPQASRPINRPEPVRSPDRPSGDRQDDRDSAREDRQDHRDSAREDWQDHDDDRWDDHRHYYGGGVVAGMAIGAAAGSRYVYSLPCNNTIYVNNITYYHCDTTWYSRGYESGEVVYIITTAPSGY